MMMLKLSLLSFAALAAARETVFFGVGVCDTNHYEGCQSSAGIAPQVPLEFPLDTTTKNIATWLKAPLVDSSLLVVEGNLTAEPDPFGLTECAQSGHHLHAYTKGDFLYLAYTVENTYWEPCQVLRAPIERGVLFHLELLLAPKHQHIVINGKVVISVLEDFSWPQDAVLTLINATFVQLDISEDETHVFADGLAGTPVPIPSTSTVVIFEDAEVVPGSHEIDWYHSENEALEDREAFTLDFDSSDKEVSAVLASAGIEYEGSTVYLYITELPSTGRLLVDGLDGAQEFKSYAPDTIFTFLPTQNWYGMLPFRYCVSTFPIYHASKCDSIEVIITVSPVNDPPLAIAPERAEFVEGQSLVMRLEGYDVESGIEAVQITKTPSFGFLTLYVGQFRSDGLTHGQAVSNDDVFLSEKDVYVEYHWAENNKFIVPGEGLEDKLSFRFKDAGGLWSSEKDATILVKPSIVLNEDNSTLVVAEDTTGNVCIFGTDSLQREIGVFVENPPSVGSLRDHDDELNAGTMVSATLLYPFDQGICFTYAPPHDYCNASQSLDFRLVAMSPVDHSIQSISQIHTKEIMIECTDDELAIVLTATAIETHQLLSHELAVGTCHGFRHNSTEWALNKCNASGSLPHLLVHGKDLESNHRRVRVKVSTDHGFITFGESAWDSVLPIKGRRRIQSKEVIYEAFPEDLSELFRNWYYQSLIAAPDRVHVTLEYGEGCGDIEVHCQVLHEFIDVTVHPQSDTQNELVQDVFPWPILFCLILFPTVYFVFALTIFWLDEAKMPTQHATSAASVTSPTHGENYIDPNADDESIIETTS